MKKQLIIVGIAVLLVFVGLSGCEQLSGETSIKEIQDHANNYIGKTVTIRGQYISAGFFLFYNEYKRGCEYDICSRFK